jgi:hypothetical protein
MNDVIVGVSLVAIPCTMSIHEFPENMSMASPVLELCLYFQHAFKISNCIKSISRTAGLIIINHSQNSRWVRGLTRTATRPTAAATRARHIHRR